MTRHGVARPADLEQLGVALGADGRAVELGAQLAARVEAAA